MIWLNRLHSLRPWLDSEYGYEHEAMYILTLRLCLCLSYLSPPGPCAVFDVVSSRLCALVS